MLPILRLAVDGFVAAVEPGGADLLQIAAGDLIEAAVHDRLEAGVECVQCLLVAFVVGLEPRHIVVIDEAAQGRGASTAAALCDGQRLAVLAGLVEVLQRLFAGLLKRQDADTAERLLAATRPGHDVRLRSGAVTRTKSPGTVVSWTSYSLPVTSRLFSRRAVSFSRTLSPWVQCGCKSDYTGLIYRMQRDAKCLICKVSA